LGLRSCSIHRALQKSFVKGLAVVENNIRRDQSQSKIASDRAGESGPFLELVCLECWKGQPHFIAIARQKFFDFFPQQH
jgi:hypothetical protein